MACWVSKVAALCLVTLRNTLRGRRAFGPDVQQVFATRSCRPAAVRCGAPRCGATAALSPQPSGSSNTSCPAPALLCSPAGSEAGAAGAVRDARAFDPGRGLGRHWPVGLPPPHPGLHRPVPPCTDQCMLPLLCLSQQCLSKILQQAVLAVPAGTAGTWRSLTLWLPCCCFAGSGCCAHNSGAEITHQLSCTPLPRRVVVQEGSGGAGGSWRLDLKGPIGLGCLPMIPTCACMQVTDSMLGCSRCGSQSHWTIVACAVDPGPAIPILLCSVTATGAACIFQYRTTCARYSRLVPLSAVRAFALSWLLGGACHCSFGLFELVQEWCTRLS